MTNTLEQQLFEQAAWVAAQLYQAGARRVWLFGSLACGRTPDRRTDIDLAVEGLEFEAVKRLSRRLRVALPCKLDLIGLEFAPPQLRKEVLANCRLLNYDAEAALPQPAKTGFNGASSKSLPQQRYEAVIDVLKHQAARRVLDLGCGAGWLLERLAADEEFLQIAGVDASIAALQAARKRLNVSEDDAATGRIQLLHALATNPDARFLGYDAVTAIEVIEHLDAPRLLAFAQVVFAYLRPRLVILTTPNAEYNVVWQSGAPPALRHRGHRFEWTRREFQDWLERAAGRCGYTYDIKAIGTPHHPYGSPTQMAVCTRETL